MKKTLQRGFAILLSCIMIFSANFTSVFAAQSIWQRIGTGALGTVISGALGAINSILPDGKNFIAEEDYESHDFYKGNDTFLSAPSQNACWRLGYNSVSLVPDDWREHQYYIGGYIMAENWFTNKVEGIIDDMKARVIAVDDSSGRGVSVFATIDCIGMTNSDIKEIRRRLVEKSDGKFNFATINVASTHCHSGIDTEGIWTNLFGKLIPNIFKLKTGLGEVEQGTDKHYMDFLFDKVSDAMLEACNSMTEGKLTISRKDIGEGYFTNKNRSSASAMLTDMTVMTFTPFNKSTRATKIVNIAAHPDVAGLPTSDGQSSGREVSGDYVYYMDELISKAGFNCMFFNGAIAGIYMARGLTNDSQDFNRRWEQSMRYGHEIAKMALSLNLTQAQIKQNKLLYDEEEIKRETEIAEKNGGEYTLWCEGWTPVDETEVKPFFNIRMKEIRVPVTNPFILMAGKLKMANYEVIKAENGYEISTEVGYMEFGDSLKAVTAPGEICPDIIYGGTSLTASDSYSGKDYEYPKATEIFNSDELLCFGLMNDAVGYIVPDNDYCMALAFDHYHELVSLGKHIASSVSKAYTELAK